VSQDIISVVQNASVVDTSDLHTELEGTKERFQNCIIKKETEYAKLWNDWYKKCNECKYDKISYDKAYKDMQQKIERLQAQLGDLKEETLQLAQKSHEKMKQMNKEIKPANYTKINHLSGVFVPQKALSREELYFSNNSKTTNVSKLISIPNEDFLDDTTPNVARKFLNEETAKFVGDFKSLANEADASLAKHKALELEIERLLKQLSVRIS
nr:hypothetical protein [Tanacetum cinerariifolium]